MEARAIARYQRIAPRKVRVVLDLIRGKDVDTALQILRFVPRRASRIVEKVVRSAVANAQNNYDMDPRRLYIHRVYADQGPMLKRLMPRARGVAYLIRKRTSHITVVLRERGE